jgi:hypothetical protein
MLQRTHSYSNTSPPTSPRAGRTTWPGGTTPRPTATAARAPGCSPPPCMPAARSSWSGSGTGRRHGSWSSGSSSAASREACAPAPVAASSRCAHSATATPTGTTRSSRRHRSRRALGSATTRRCGTPTGSGIWPSPSWPTASPRPDPRPHRTAGRTIFRSRRVAPTNKPHRPPTSRASCRFPAEIPKLSRSLPALAVLEQGRLPSDRTDWYLRYASAAGGHCECCCERADP